jgi:hypothetical protein
LSALDVDVEGDFTMGGSSIVSSKWIPKRNSTLNREVRDDGSQGNLQWTVTERAELVTSNTALSVLLEAEVGKSGVVTFAGYKAIYQKFLYSDAVEEELRKKITRSSVTSNVLAVHYSFGDLVKSIQEHQRGRSSTGDAAVIGSYDPLSSCTSSDRNLAPRRLSISSLSLDAPSAISQAQREMEDLQYLEDDLWDALLTNVVAPMTLSSSKDDETSEPHHMKSRKAHLIIREIDLDPLETIVKTKSHDERARNSDDSSTLDSNFSESADEDECGWLPWPKEQTNNSWLPWPKEHTDATDDDSHGEEGWLPWPLKEDN